MRLSTFAGPEAPEAPDLGGLQFGATTFDEVHQRLGSRVSVLDLPPLLLEHRDGSGVSLVYSLPGEPEALVVLRFADAAQTDGDAVLEAVSLMLRDAVDPDSYATELPDDTAPPGFPVPLDEAFPSLIP